MSHPQKKCDHDTNRKKICYFCAKNPLGICDKCRSNIGRKNYLPDLVIDWTKNVIIPLTRNSTSCQCKICKLTSLRGRTGTRRRSSKFSKSHAPHKKICKSCLSNIGKGKKHKCGNKTLAVKIYEKLQTSAKVKDQIASQVISEKSYEQGSKRIKLSTGAKPLQISVGPLKNKPRQITLIDLLRIQSRLTLSNKKLIQLAKKLR